MSTTCHDADGRGCWSRQYAMHRRYSPSPLCRDFSASRELLGWVSSYGGHGWELSCCGVAQARRHKKEKKNSYRNNAISAGVLFIIADLVGFLSLPFMAPVNATNYLVSVSTNEGLVATAALLLSIGGAAAIGIAISMYPVLREYNEGLALGSVGFRTVEGMLDIVAVMDLPLLITLSQEFVKAGAPDSSYFQTLGVLSVSGFHWAVNVMKLMAFSIGCLLYYIIFYRTKLIPRWLSGWGVVAAIMTMLSALLTMYGLSAPFSTAQIVLNLPILPQELVLAVWLIIKGFNPSAIDAGSDKVGVN